MNGNNRKITEFFLPRENSQASESNNEADSSREDDEPDNEPDLSQPSEPDDEPGDDPIEPTDSLPQCLIHHKWTIRQFAFLASLPLAEDKPIELTHICRQLPHRKVHLYLKFFPNIKGSVKIQVQSNAKLRTFGKVFILTDGGAHICLQGDEKVDAGEYHRLHFNRDYKRTHTFLEDNQLLPGDELKIGAECVFYQATDTEILNAEIVDRIRMENDPKIESVFDFVRPQTVYQFQVEYLATKLQQNWSGRRCVLSLEKTNYFNTFIEAQFQVDLQPNESDWIDINIKLLTHISKEKFLTYITWFCVFIRKDEDQTRYNMQSKWNIFQIKNNTILNNDLKIERFASLEDLKGKCSVICQMIILPTSLTLNSDKTRKPKQEINQCLKNYDTILSYMRHETITPCQTEEREIIPQESGSPADDLLNYLPTCRKAQMSVGSETLNVIRVLGQRNWSKQPLVINHNQINNNQVYNYYSQCVLANNGTTNIGEINFGNLHPETKQNVQRSIQLITKRVTALFNQVLECDDIIERTEKQRESLCQLMVPPKGESAPAPKRQLLISASDATIEDEAPNRVCIKYALQVKEGQSLLFKINVSMPISGPIDPSRPVLTTADESEDLTVFLSSIREIRNTSSTTTLLDSVLTNDWAHIFVYADLPEMARRMPKVTLQRYLDRSNQMKAKHNKHLAIDENDETEESLPKKAKHEQIALQANSVSQQIYELMKPSNPNPERFIIADHLSKESVTTVNFQASSPVSNPVSLPNGSLFSRMSIQDGTPTVERFATDSGNVSQAGPSFLSQMNASQLVHATDGAYVFDDIQLPVGDTPPNSQANVANSPNLNRSSIENSVVVENSAAQFKKIGFN